MSPEPLLGSDVWKFAAGLKDKAQKDSFVAALKLCVIEAPWAEMPFPYPRGFFGARLGGFYFIAKKDPSGAMYVVQVGRPTDFMFL